MMGKRALLGVLCVLLCVAAAAGQDLYELLGVSSSATASQMKRAYRKLSLKYHPDKQTTETREAMKEEFVKISNAYRVLSDPERREKYDVYGIADEQGFKNFDEASRFAKDGVEDSLMNWVGLVAVLAMGVLPIVLLQRNRTKPLKKRREALRSLARNRLTKSSDTSFSKSFSKTRKSYVENPLRPQFAPQDAMDELKVTLLSPPEGEAGSTSASTSSASSSRRQRVEAAWMYPPQGEAHDLRVPAAQLAAIRGKLEAPQPKLGEWPSTAICGNDILASVLYSSGIVAAKAGKLTPLAQALVAVVLYLFRYIYEEAVTAIPLNGGSYNVLLNTTSKRTAAVAATLGIISYLATGVVSGTSALRYLNTQLDVDVVPGTVVLLFAFALLSIVGIAESAHVALFIFVMHVLTLTLLSGFSALYALQHPQVFATNMQTDFPSVNVAGHLIGGNVLTGIFYGYSSAMLGITGFETSAQFVEEQAPGVFRKTLRNMWVFATLYNLLLSFLSLAVLPLEGAGGIYSDKDVVLASMGRVAAGTWLQRWVSIDAFVVLAGGVLTSYVGITGLVRRLAYDRVLPAFLTHTNAWRGTNHHIILLFFALQASLVVLLHADATVLAGVFTFAFLGVMALFAFGCMLLKLKREDIPRDVHAPWWSCIFGLLMVLLGLLGNLLGDPAILTYFAIYFVIFSAAMFLMLERVFILRILLYVMQQLCPSRRRESDDEDVEMEKRTGAWGGRTITAALETIHLPPIVFLCKTPDLAVINKAILYVRTNEQTHNLRVVHVCEDAELQDTTLDVTEADTQRRRRARETVAELRDMACRFDRTYPKLKVDFVGVYGARFDAALVQWLAQELHVPPNMMFIRQPGDKHIHQVASLGVRVITG